MKNWDKYSKEHHLFILSQSEKYLRAQVEVLDSAQKRGQLQAITAVSGASYFINELTSNEPIFSAPFMVAFATTLCVSAAMSLYGIFSYNVKYPGTATSDLIKDECQPHPEVEINELNLICSEWLNYSDRIEDNKKVSETKVKIISRSYMLLIFSPLFALIFQVLYAALT